MRFKTIAVITFYQQKNTNALTFDYKMWYYIFVKRKGGLKMKKTTSVIFMSFCILCSTLTVSATSQPISGGWSEDDGLMQAQIGDLKSTPYHYGSVQERNAIPPTSIERRALGTTQWPGVYHYTRARMENRFTGGIYTDSERVYGISTTNAVSPWYTDSFEFNFSIGRTYYGN